MSLTHNLSQIVKNTRNQTKINIRCISSAIFEYDKDPSEQFLNPTTQKLLKSMTKVQMGKLFRKRSVPENKVDYKFMTTEELENQFLEIVRKAETFLQMPPVVSIKPDTKNKIISNDSPLKEFSKLKYVIADITYGLKDSERKVVIRNTDGVLEHAPMAIRKRINQTYFPMPGRKILTPRLFEEQHLNRCLDEHKYEFILNRTLVQFEPYEKEFHEICAKVYSHLNETKKFDDLRSTRHFGPMVFFYSWHKIIDDLLFDMIKRDYLRNGVELISLSHNLNSIEYDKDVLNALEKIPQSEGVLSELKKQLKSGTSDDIHEEIKQAIGKTDQDFKADEICLKFIENYIESKAMKKLPLKLAIQSFKENNDEKKKLYDGLKKVHGVNQ